MSTSVSVDKSLQPLLWLVAIGLFMQTLDSTIVNTALPAMARSLSESPLKMQSVIIAYTLTTVSYTHLTLPTTCTPCRSRWSPYH